MNITPSTSTHIHTQEHENVFILSRKVVRINMSKMTNMPYLIMSGAKKDDNYKNKYEKNDSRKNKY